MNKTLFLGTLKANYTLVVGITLFTLIYVTVSIGMFTPGSNEAMEAMLTMLPDQMVKAFGFDQLTGSLTSYLAGYLFGFILLTFPSIYVVIMANRLIAKLVDKGSMAYLLTSTNTRIKVAVTQFAFMVVGLVFIFLVDYLVAIVMAESFYPGDLDPIAYLQLNLLTFFAILFLGSVCFLFSCIFNESRISTSASSAITGLFIIAHMLTDLGDELSFLRYFTVFSVVDIEKGLNDGGYVLAVSLILLIASGFVGLIGISLFNKRSLTI